TTAGFQDALTTAVHDATNKPSVISISWGGPESGWTIQAMTAFDAAAQDAALLGVSICAASGDNGSSDGVRGRGKLRGFPGLQPAHSGLRGDQLAERQRNDFERDGLERWRARRRYGRRVQRAVSAALLAGERRRDTSLRRRAGRAGCFRGCRPGIGIPGAGGWGIPGHRRHQRGRAAMERLDCATQSEARESLGIPPAGPLWVR